MSDEAGNNRATPAGGGGAWRRKRFLIYLLILLGVLAWRFVPRAWRPTVTIETVHYSVSSTATRDQAEETARAVEILHASYSNRFYTLTNFNPRPAKLKLLLYKDRAEMRRVNPGLGWAEAFYEPPFCRAYFSADESNPHHWMIHEAVHQLNTEVARVKLSKWLEEGLATYWSTCRVLSNRFETAHLDVDTYPVWWFDDLATTPDLQTNLANGSVIPLRAIITNRGGPAMRGHVNLYYLHWWTLTRFVFESPRHAGRALELVQAGGDLAAFEKLIGPLPSVEAEWHAYVRHLKSVLAGNDREFLRTGRIPPMVTGPLIPNSEMETANPR
jgi:hypothetical protein